MKNLIHSFDQNTLENNNQIKYSVFFTLIFFAVTIGIFIGLGLTKLNTKQNNKTLIKEENTIGVIDKNTFKDQAEGILKEGGIDGEGNFRLERPGGESQNVYLTSSTVDLSKYIGKKVKVWGQTFSGEKAGWLMDVGLVEILEK